MRTIGTERLIGAGLVVLALALIGAATGINMNQVRTAAPGAVNVGGVAAAEGGSLAAARADHVHSLTGVLPVANGGTGNASGQAATAAGLAGTSGLASAATFLRGDWSWQALPGQDWSVITGKPSTFPATTPVATATALAANGSNCAVGQAAAGVDSSGNAEGCFAPTATLGSATYGAGCGTAGEIRSDGNNNVLICDSGFWAFPLSTQRATAAYSFVSNPSDCSAGTKATAIDQYGNLSCSSVDLMADTAATALPPSKGGTGLTSIFANQAWVGTAANTVAAKTLPSCSNATTSKLLYDNATQVFSCGTDQTGSGTMTRLTASWASSASSNALGVVGTGGVPMTSPTYSANAPFSVRCVIRTIRPATTNGPRYGLQTSGTFTALSATVSLGLAGTAPARTENTYELTTAATASCAAGCTAAITTGTLAQAFNDIIEATGQVGTSGTVSLVMAPSAAAANTAQIGSYCVWY